MGQLRGGGGLEPAHEIEKLTVLQEVNLVGTKGEASFRLPFKTRGVPGDPTNRGQKNFTRKKDPQMASFPRGQRGEYNGQPTLLTQLTMGSQVSGDVGKTAYFPLENSTTPLLRLSDISEFQIF